MSKIEVVLPLERNVIHIGDAIKKLKLLPSNSVDCVITSPPYYGLRNYGVKGQLGLEKTPELYIKKMVMLFEEIRRVLKPSGTVWLNIGDSYWGGKGKSGQEKKSSLQERIHTGESFNKVCQNIEQDIRPTDRKHPHIKPKDLIGIPWMLAFALRKKGWYLRQDVIWNKKNCMPESVKDRCTKSHEYIFLLSKSPKYYFDYVAIQQPMAEYEVERRMKEKNKGLNSTYDLKRDDNTGLANQSQTGAVRNVARRHELAERGMANKRSVWTIASSPYTGAHYATFSEDLIVDCIRAGTSEKGYCSHCGKPYIRLVKTELVPTIKASHNSKVDERDLSADSNDAGSNWAKDGHKPGWVNKTTTIGWEASCKCNATIIPGVILDPFMGHATTAITSRKLDRDYVGIEINPKDVKESHKRIHKTLGIFK